MKYDDKENTNFRGMDGQGLRSEGKYEPMGVHRSAPNPKLAQASGFGGPKDGSEGVGFNPLAKGYAGPGRIALDTGKPKERSNQDIKNSV